ncbi:hypothetical protein QOZ80_2BG0198250 [Eleusine coracana subsp. coracana]|nr:hypothetical protein QOZ80_2BG0198250 [Eleusine coracana subsp. coracana]
MVSSEEILERPRIPGSKLKDPAPSLHEDGPAAPHCCLICMKPIDRSGPDMMTCRDNETSIRVTNLSNKTCEKDLYNLGCQFGFITRITLASDEKAGSHTQIGIVEFEQRDEAEEAIKWLNGHSYDSLPLQVDWATPERKEASETVLEEADDPAPVCESCMQVVEVSVHVTDLPENTCEHDLYNLFCQFGFMNRYYLALDEKAGSGMLCGIIEFEQREDAEVAISWINGHVYGGHSLQVKWATADVLSGLRKLN